MDFATLQSLLSDMPSFLAVCKDKCIRVRKEVVDGHTLYTPKYANGADFSDPLVQQCRGLVVSDSGRVVCYPFPKFFNAEEPQVHPVDLDNCLVTEKRDGSLIKHYEMGGKWYWATSGRAICDENFSRMVQDAMPSGADDWQKDSNLTYLFELVHPQNRIIIPYSDPGLTFLAAYDRNTGQEMVGMDTPFPVPQVRNVHPSSLDLEHVEGIEGYVLIDKATRNRVKRKTKWYVGLHTGYAQTTDDYGLLKLLRDGKVDDYLAYHQVQVDRVEYLRARLHAHEQRVQELRELIAGKTRKEAIAYLEEHAPSLSSFVLAKKPVPTKMLLNELLRT